MLLSLHEVFEMYKQHQSVNHKLQSQQRQESASKLADAVNSLSLEDQDKIAIMMSEGGKMKPCCHACPGACQNSSQEGDYIN